MEWRAATIDKVKEIVVRDLAKCDAHQIAAYHQYSVEPHFASLLRYGNLEKVVVVARNSSEVIYWEDVEEGFNVSPVDPDELILEHWCNQDELGIALNRWIEGGNGRDRFGPAKSSDEN